MHKKKKLKYILKKLFIISLSLIMEQKKLKINKNKKIKRLEI